MAEKKHMTEEEFIKKAKELGYTDEDIQEYIQMHEETKRELGVGFPYESFILAEPPIEN